MIIFQNFKYYISNELKKSIIFIFIKEKKKNGEKKMGTSEGSKENPPMRCKIRSLSKFSKNLSELNCRVSEKARWIHVAPSKHPISTFSFKPGWRHKSSSNMHLPPRVHSISLLFSPIPPSPRVLSLSIEKIIIWSRNSSITPLLKKIKLKSP